VEKSMRAVFGQEGTLVIPCPRPNSNSILVGSKGGFQTREVGGKRGPEMERRHFAQRCHALSTSLKLPFDVAVSLPMWWWI
jgi:hypothetical protein